MITNINKILCIDIGSTSGWAYFDNKITSGSIKFKDNNYSGGGAKYLNFANWLKKFKPDIVYFEEVKKHSGTIAAHTYGGFLAVLTAWAEKNNIPYTGVGVGIIKKHFTGKGNAKKQEMINAAEFLGHKVKDDNEADALGLLYYVLDQNQITIEKLIELTNKNTEVR